MKDRTYQENMFNQIRHAIGSGHKRILVVLPTGGGKGVCTARIMQMSSEKGTDSVFFAAQRELITQISKHLVRFGVPYRTVMAGVEDEYATFDDYMKGNHTTLVAKDTLWARAFRNNKIEIPPAKVVHIDECHASLSKTYQAIMEKYSDSIVIGWTATPCRSDNKPLGQYYDVLIQGATYKELQTDGFLVPVRVIAPDRPDLKGCKVSRGDYSKGDLEKRMNRDEMVGSIVKEWLDHAQGRSTVVFAAGISHSIHIRNLFRAEGITAEHIDGTMPIEERDSIMERARSGEVRVVTNYGVLHTGVDVPQWKYLICARPTKSFSLWRQMCLDSETEVLTASGWARDGQVQDGDIVATFDDKTGSVLWCCATNVFSRPIADDEYMVALKSAHMDIRVTSTHEMICADRNTYMRTGRWSRQNAGDLAKKLGASVIPVSGVDPFLADIPLSDDEIRFIGLFVTDGSWDKKSGAVRIAQSTAKPKAFHDYIRSAIEGCGFKYSVYRRKRQGKWSKYADGLEYHVSKGAPRGTDKHLSGWGRLEPYMNKDLSGPIKCLSKRQFVVLLEAMNIGDGRTSPPSDGTIRRTMSITAGCDRRLADNVQAMCVVRGFRCNVSTHHYNRQTLYDMLIRGHSASTIGGASSKDREKFRPSESQHGETVWCMTTTHGALITRRNGKVAIVGNCGRIQRPYPGHDHCVIQDHSDNALVLGFPDEDVEWEIDGDGDIAKKHREKKAREKKDGKEEGDPYRCEKCHAVYRGYRCPSCGHRPEEKGKAIKMKPGELKELERKKANREATPMDKQKFWDECLGWAIGGNKLVGAAAHRYKERFGVFPNASIENVPRSSQWKMRGREFHHKVIKPAQERARQEMQRELLQG